MRSNQSRRRVSLVEVITFLYSEIHTKVLLFCEFLPKINNKTDLKEEF
jgi:hypothetical protein